ncbi:PAS domain S-box protein, partial [Halobium palmae]
MHVLGRPADASGPVDLTPLFFVPTGLVIAWGLLRYRMLDLLPVARDLAVEHMTDAVVVLDAEDRVVDFNPAAASLFDLAAADLGTDAGTALGVDGGAALADGEDYVREADEEDDGSDERRYFEVDSVTVRDGRDDVRGRLYLFHDVSDRRNRERWLRTLTENASDVVAVLGNDGTIRYGGQSMEARLGYEPADIVGRDVTTLLHPDDRDRVRERFVGLLRDPGGQRNTEMRVRRADGSYRTFDVYWRNLLDDPAVEGVVVNAHDVTERKARERRLKRQNEQLDAFASVVSHDLRNPLNVASGFLDLARETGDPDHFDRVA